MTKRQISMDRGPVLTSYGSDSTQSQLNETHQILELMEPANFRKWKNFHMESALGLVLGMLVKQVLIEDLLQEWLKACLWEGGKSQSANNGELAAWSRARTEKVFWKVSNHL